MAESSKSESSETKEKEKSPEQVVDSAVSTSENKDAQDPEVSSQLAAEAKFYGKGLGAVSAYGFDIARRTLTGLLKFAKKLIQKKGGVGFGEGYDIGRESFSDKKEKK